MATAPAGWRSYGDLLRNRNLMLYIFSYHVMHIGKQMTFFAIWGQVTHMTGQDASSLGLATMLNILPGILVAPWAGLMADRVSKQKLLIACFLTEAFLVALMFLSTELWHLYLLASLHSLVAAFGDPPHRALLPLLVKPDQYVTMNALLASLNNIFQLFRPALAGLVVAVFGAKTAFAIDFFTYFVPAIALMLIRVHDAASTRSQSPETRTSAWQDLRGGIAYIRTEPVLLFLFVFMMMLTLAMSMQGPLIFLFAGEHLTTPDDAPRVAGLLFSTLGIGGIIGAIFTPRLLQKLPIFQLLFVALAFDGAVVVVFAFSDNLWMALSSFALLGIIGSVNNIVQETLIQRMVPEHLRGRVYGAIAPITGPMSLLSIAIGTTAAGWIGVQNVLLLAGLLEIVAVLVCRLLPSYNRVRRSATEKLDVVNS